MSVPLIIYFGFLSALNEKSILDVVKILVKLTNILPPQTNVNPFGQNIHVTKALAFDNTFSETIASGELSKVPEKKAKPRALVTCKLIVTISKDC